MNTYARMRHTNYFIRHKMIDHGWTDFNLAPHTRFTKDFHIEDMPFDAFCWKEGVVYFAQFKTNMKCPQKIMDRYSELELNRKAKFVWVSREKSKIVLYSVENPKGLVLE